MGFLNDNHQGARLLALIAFGRFFQFHIAVVDAAGEEVAYQDVGGQVAAVAAELQDYMLPPFQMLDDAGGGVMAAAGFQKGKAFQAAEAVVQGGQSRPVHIQLFSQLAHFRPRKFDKAAQPIPAKMLLQVIGRGGRHFRQVQGIPQQFHILRFNLAVANPHYFIGSGPAPPGTFRVQGKGGHPGRKQLFQPFDLPGAVRILPAPAVFAVHIKDQGGGAAAVQDADQQQAG